MTIKPTRQHAVAILDLLKHGLCKGKGVPEPGKMCVEAAVCFAMGLPHSDEPPCVAPSVRAFKIALNDSDWSSDKARAKGLQKLAIAQLGSIEIDETVFAKELVLATVRRVLPVALRAAAKIHPDDKQKKSLETEAAKCEQVTQEAAARSAAESAWSAAESARSAAESAWSAAESARSAAESAWSAARSAARSAAESARSAWSAARSAWSAESAAESAWSAESARSAWSAWSAESARSAAESARSAAESARSAAEAKDEVLMLVADCAVDALIKAKSPGCEWLDLIKD